MNPSTVVESVPQAGERAHRHPAVLAALAVLAILANGLWLLPMHDDLGDARVALGLGVAAAFASAGAVAMRLRPGNPTGAAMLVLALVVNLGEAGLETVLPWRFTIGMTMEGTAAPLIAVLALAFPTGRLRGRWVWALCLSLGGLTVAVVVLRALWWPPGALCLSCPPAGNVLFVGNAPVEVAPFFDLLAVALAIVVALVMATLLARWARASPPRRRVLGPVLLTTVLLTAKVTLDLLVLEPDLAGKSPTDWRLRIVYPNQALTALIPVAFLLAVARSEFGRSPLARLLADVVDDRAPARFDHALAAALGDPSVQVGYRAAGTDAFVDLDGRRLELPGPEAGSRATYVGDPDDPLAVIVHDVALAEDGRQLEAAAAAAGMTLRREWLRAELRLRLNQVSDSRQRLIGAVEEERLRMEYALERGVERRLDELAAILGEIASGEEDVPRAALDDVLTQMRLARADLRAFVHGMRPGIIAADGLAAALQELASSAPVPVELRSVPARDLAEALENAIWFVCSESLVNVAKHARATRAEMDIRVDRGVVTVTVTDDGAGGATERRGGGLDGLRERVGALGGTLSITGATGSGTIVRADLPLHPGSAD